MKPKFLGKLGKISWIVKYSEKRGKSGIGGQMHHWLRGMDVPVNTSWRKNK